jgi:hypothetical protein
MKQHETKDINRPGVTGLPLGDPEDASKADFTPMTSVTSPPSPNQPNATFPERMNPRSPEAASQPVVAEGAAFLSARATSPPSPAPTKPAATPGMSFDDIRNVAARYGGMGRRK